MYTQTSPFWTDCWSCLSEIARWLEAITIQSSNVLCFSSNHFASLSFKLPFRSEFVTFSQFAAIAASHVEETMGYEKKPFSRYGPFSLLRWVHSSTPSKPSSLGWSFQPMEWLPSIVSSPSRMILGFGISLSPLSSSSSKASLHWLLKRRKSGNGKVLKYWGIWKPFKNSAPLRRLNYISQFLIF